MCPIASSGLVEEANKLYRTKVQEGTGKENILQSHDNDNECVKGQTAKERRSKKKKMTTTKRDDNDV